MAFNTLEKGYFEAEIGLSDFLRFGYLSMGYLSFGLDVYYRYGAYAMADSKDNFTYKLNMSL